MCGFLEKLTRERDRETDRETDRDETVFNGQNCPMGVEQKSESSNPWIFRKMGTDVQTYKRTELNPKVFDKRLLGTNERMNKY